MSTNCAVCYVSDLNFLLPTIISAVSVRRFIAPDKAAVFIFLTDPVEALDDLRRAVSPQQIELIELGKDFINVDAEKFVDAPTPPSTLGRLFMADLLPENYERIVYLDGDTLVRRDPTALIEAVVPEGRMAAVDDMTSFRYSPYTVRGRLRMDYLAGLGIDMKKNRYLNAGVLTASRSAWRTIGREAYDFFIRETKACAFVDQSALNAVMGDRRLPLSIKWNFQTPFRFVGVEDEVRPSIYHFFGSPKPWMGPCEPWRDFDPIYREEIAPFAAFNLPLKRMSEADLANHNALNWRKKLLQNNPVAAWVSRMHLGFDAYEKRAWL